MIEDADAACSSLTPAPAGKAVLPHISAGKPDARRDLSSASCRRAESSDARSPARVEVDHPASLTTLLKDDRPAVQGRAVRELGARTTGAIPALADVLKSSTFVDARRNAVWALARIQGAEARGAGRIAIADADDSVRHAAIYTAGLWRDVEAAVALREVLKSGRPQLQRGCGRARTDR